MKLDYKKLVGVVFYCFVSIGGYTQIACLVKGKAAGQTGIAILEFSDKGQHHSDSNQIVKDTFSFSESISGPVLAVLKLKDRGVQIRFFLDSGVTNIDLAHSPSPGIQGGKVQREYESYMESVRDVLPQMNRAYDSYWNLEPGEKRDSFYDRYLKSQMELKSRIADFVRLNNNSIVGAWAVSQNYYNATSEEISALYDQFGPGVKKSSYGMEVEELSKQTFKSAIGKKLNVYSTRDPAGRLVSFPDLGALYTLVDFWASWCLPCRKENPHLKQVYEKYHDRGFEIVGFSLDDNRENWIKAIEADNINWLNVSDLKGWGKSDICNDLGVNNVPMNLLIDKENRVVARNLRGNDLDRFLSKLFATK